MPFSIIFFLEKFGGFLEFFLEFHSDIKWNRQEFQLCFTSFIEVGRWNREIETNSPDFSWEAASLRHGAIIWVFTEFHPDTKKRIILWAIV